MYENGSAWGHLFAGGRDDPFCGTLIVIVWYPSEIHDIIEKWFAFGGWCGREFIITKK